MNFYPNKSNHIILWSFTFYPSRHSGGRVARVSDPHCSGFGPPSSHFAPVNNHACVVLWYLHRKELCEHPISNQQNQHNLSQWIIPKPFPPSLTNTPSSTSHAGLLHHPIYIFIGQLSSSFPSLSGSRVLSNRGNLSHSLIERLSGDYGEVRNKVVWRNHKQKPFLSLC